MQNSTKLLLINKQLVDIYKNASDELTYDGVIDLRDLCLNMINKIDLYGQKYTKNWKSQDLGAV